MILLQINGVRLYLNPMNFGTRIGLMTDGVSRIIVTQLGARGNYAVPITFYRADLLEQFHTDIWLRGVLRKWLQIFSSFINSNGLRKWCGRYTPELPPEKVRSHSFIGYKYVWRKRRCKTPDDRMRVDLWAAKKFGEAVVKEGFNKAKIVYCIKDAKEIFEASEGNYKILEQVDCPELYWKIRTEELEHWHGWEENLQLSILEELIERDKYSQEKADKIIAPSEFVFEYLVSQGVTSKKIAIVPYGFNSQDRNYSLKRFTGERKLRVLYVGAVNLMKGIPYLLKGIDLLNDKDIEVRLVGPIFINECVLKKWEERYKFIGQVPRSEVYSHYEWADIFVFPTLCEGSAGVIYEALSYGLPTITTPHSGSVITDGKEGFIIPIRDEEAIALSIRKFIDSPRLLEEMSQAALELSKKHTLEEYGKRLINAVIKDKVL
jgi:glycosyltransferase involved in cell wall biosynthesis